MVFGSTLLEVALGVAFVYLLLSLLCSALTELLETFVKFRARDLERGISKLLHDSSLATEFFTHPLIKPMGEKPSYIPARTFSLALWNLATTAAAKGDIAAGVTQDLSEIRKLIASLEAKQYDSIKTSLLALIDEAGGDLNRARLNVERWYNDAMDRVSGWYKRRTHLLLIVIGLLAAAFLNVDTINVVQALWYNDTLRHTVAAAAEDYAKSTQPPNPNAAVAPAEVNSSTVEQQATVVRKKINEVRDELNTLGLPIGWIRNPSEPQRGDEKYKQLTEDEFKREVALYHDRLTAFKGDPRRPPATPMDWLLKIIGIFLTALAVSQGAPFWFDLLNKFIIIRSTVKPHEKSLEQPSKDRPTPQTRLEQPEGTS